MMNKAKNNKDAARDAEQNPYKKYADLIEDCEFGSEKGAENLLAILKQRDDAQSLISALIAEKAELMATCIYASTKLIQGDEHQARLALVDVIAKMQPQVRTKLLKGEYAGEPHREWVLVDGNNHVFARRTMTDSEADAANKSRNDSTRIMGAAWVLAED